LVPHEEKLVILREQRENVVHYARKMVDSQLVRANQGNISLRDPQTGLICITPSGCDYGRMTAMDIVVIDKTGDVVEGSLRPSSELPLHTLIMHRRPDVNCIMHTHSIYATAFGVVHQPLPMVLAESALCLGGTVPVTPYQLSGTPEFAEMVARFLNDGAAVIWGNHGAMVVGTTLALTYSAAHALEDGAKAYILAKQLGAPVELSQQDVAELHTFWLEHYIDTPHRLKP
jgi:L-ribulose-5-phosphate 4-epimerase